MTFIECDTLLCEILFVLLKQFYTDDKRKIKGITTTDRRVFNSDNFKDMLRKDKRNKNDYCYNYETRVCNMRHFLEYTNSSYLTLIDGQPLDSIAWQFDYYLRNRYNELTVIQSECLKRNKAIEKIIAEYKLIGTISIQRVYNLLFVNHAHFIAYELLNDK